MKKLPLSILILTKNSASIIENALLSASFAREIIILDDDSNDDTLNIAKKYGVKIIENSSHLGFADKRNILFKAASQPWLFYLDADERISEQLKSEIARVIEQKDEFVYQVNRLNIFWAKHFKYGGWSPSWVIRFFPKKKLIKWQGQLHEQPVYRGRLKSFQSSLIHLSHSSLEKSLNNTLSWSWLEAELFYKSNHKPVRWFHFFIAPLREFFYRLIKKSGYKDGLEGVLEAIMQAISKFVTYERLWELQNGKLSDKYKKIENELKKNNFDLDFFSYENKEN